MGTKAAIGVMLCYITASGSTQHNTRTLTLSGILGLAKELRTATRTCTIGHDEVILVIVLWLCTIVHCGKLGVDHLGSLWRMVC